jgi:hypothetical protein
MADNDRDNVKEDRRVHTPPATAKAADKTAKDAEKARADAEKQADEGRKLLHEREVKQAEAAFEAEENKIKQEREKKEEELRLANLSPEERAAEISPFVHSVPHYTPQNEPLHPAEFILSEANGHRSRGNAYIADPANILAGQMLKKTAEATATQPPTYVPALVGADCNAIAIYSGGTIPGEGLRISVIVRDAEVNGLCLVWGATTAPEQIIGIQTLAAAGIIVRL